MQSRIELLQSKLNKEAKKLNLGCEISPENLKDIIIIKKDGQINLKEFATTNNLDYCVSTDLINGLIDYFKDALNENSDGIRCPVSLEELHENQHPVFLYPSIGHVAGTILSKSSAIGLQRKIDPKNNGSFEKIIDAPIASFLVSHMCALKIEIEQEALRRLLLNQEVKKLNLGCEISPENLKDIVIIKKDGQINLKEFATTNNLDYFVSTDLINGLTDYFKDTLNENSDGICCPISFEELDENQHPVILCPSEGHVAGTILSNSSSSAIGLQRKTDPKNNGNFEKVIDAPIVSFLVGHMREKKMANEITVKEQAKSDKIHEKPNHGVKSNALPNYGFFAERNNNYPSNHNDQQNRVNIIKRNVQHMLNVYAVRYNGQNNRAAMTSELARKLNNLNEENLSDFLATMRSMKEAIASEYGFGNASRSLLYTEINNILEQHESNGHEIQIHSAHSIY